MPIHHIAHCRGSHLRSYPVDELDLAGLAKRSWGWQLGYEATHFPRYNRFLRAGPEATVFITQYSPHWTYRTVAEQAVMAGSKGVARIGGDFWYSVPTKGGGKRVITDRRPDMWHAISMNSGDSPVLSILWPGPDGPEPTVRMQLLREGMQDAETRIAIERGIADEASRAKLGPELVKRCVALLNQRLRAVLDGTYAFECYAGSGWEAANRAFYDLAHDVRAKLGR